MRAQVLEAPAPVETAPLRLLDVPDPEPVEDEVLIEVSACGICRTDLHVTEGELPVKVANVIPGHQVVGRIIATGRSARGVKEGDRVGAAWLHRTDGKCEFCRKGLENLCPYALFAGYTRPGGYAEKMVAPASFVYPIPDRFDDLHAAPLLCAGIIGFRALRLAELVRGDTLAIYGFGAAGHIAIQVARHMGAKVLVCTRDERHRKLALELGAAWAGGAAEAPPEPLDAAIIFAPAGELVPAALSSMKKAGRVVLGGIHMSPIPEMPYELLYHERVVRSVANNTRKDALDFLAMASEIPVQTEFQVFPLAAANEALLKLKNDAIRGAGVLAVKEN